MLLIQSQRTPGLFRMYRNLNFVAITRWKTPPFTHVDPRGVTKGELNKRLSNDVTYLFF